MLRSLRKCFPHAAAMLVAGSIAALAANTTFFTSIGDLVFPFSPPTNSGATPGTIDNMTIGGATPGVGNFSAINGPSAGTAPSLLVTGGTSSTSASQGGSARLHGGLPGATGTGGDATVRGAIGGATSGDGGLASLTGGAGTAGNANGGLSRAVGGAGQGTGTGGLAQLTAGASGAGATGNGAQAQVTGGASLATNGNGGAVVLAGGAKAGTGVGGMIIKRSVELVNQGTPTAKTVSSTMTAADLLAGIVTVAQGAAGASAQQLPLATAMDTAFPDAAAGDAFDFSMINTSVTAAESASITTNTGWTLVGDMDVQANSAVTTKSAGRFRARKTGTGAWTLYRLS